VADRAVILGARAGSEAEFERASQGDVTVVPPENVPAWSPEFTVGDGKDGEGDEGENGGGGGDPSVYLSVDVDAADPAFAPGTGTPEPFGLDSRTCRDVVRSVAETGCVDGFDVVEVNDRDDGQAAVLAAKLLRAFVYADADAVGGVERETTDT
jgi:agmatinase